MKHLIYVISKAKHADMWKVWRSAGHPINSSWIDEGSEEDINFGESWPRYLSQASEASSAVVYLEPGEELKGGMAELGAVLAHGGQVYVIGDAPQLRTLGYHERVTSLPSVGHAFRQIQILRGDVPEGVQQIVGHWVETCFGSTIRNDKHERGRRMVEEAIELGQALGVTPGEVFSLVDRVYARPVGDVAQEMGGVGVTMLALGDCLGVSCEQATMTELARILAIPPEYFRERQNAKAGVGMEVR